MWQQLLTALPELFGAAQQAGGGLNGLMNMGQGAQGVMGEKGLNLMGGAPMPGMDSLGSGLASELGGAPAGPDPFAAMSAPSSQGGLMDYQGLKMPNTGGKNASKYENEMVNAFVNQGLQGDPGYVDMSQPMYSLMNWRG